MKHQMTLENDQTEYEVVLEEEEAEKSEYQEFLPRDLEDYLYEEWRDNKALSEEREQRDCNNGPTEFVEVVKIGTRALISINGKLMLATHWDGHPSLIGLDLLRCDKSLGAVIEVAKAHTIDATDQSIREEVNHERVRKLAKKHRLTENEIRDGKRRGAVICADDYEIGDIDNYRDWAEYQYDIRGKKVYFRALKGWYPESVEKAAEFKLLTEEKDRKG